MGVDTRLMTSLLNYKTAILVCGGASLLVGVAIAPFCFKVVALPIALSFVAPALLPIFALSCAGLALCAAGLIYHYFIRHFPKFGRPHQKRLDGPKSKARVRFKKQPETHDGYQEITLAERKHIPPLFWRSSRNFCRDFGRNSDMWRAKKYAIPKTRKAA
jgi:hypothetical protein